MSVRLDVKLQRTGMAA